MRHKTLSVIQEQLAQYTDRQLLDLFNSGQVHHNGIGGTSVLLIIKDTPVFVKQIPLTDVERLPVNWRTTANLFNLPPFYHYGVGSAGFSAWRELAAHEVTTQWVLEQECPNFPLLYHWRVIDSETSPIGEDVRNQIETDVAYWDGSDAVRKRLEAVYSSSSHVYLFLEYVPMTLYDWLQSKLKEHETSAIQFVESKLMDTCKFMRSKGFIHFDAHFQNILTDGEKVYFTDFGLCSSKQFNLEEDEKAFHQQHLLYDQASVSVNLLHCVITSYFGSTDWISNLKACLSGEHEIQPEVIAMLEKHGETALTMDEFYSKLQKVSKSSPFPISIDNEIIVRPAVLSDAEAIANVHVQAWQESYQGIYDTDYLESLSYEKRLPFRRNILETSSPQSLHLVAEHNRQVIGFLDAGPSHELREGVWGEVYAIYLLEEYKGLGLGTRLMRMADEFLRERNLAPYVVWALEDNRPARQFYEKLGGSVRFETFDDRSGTRHRVVGYLIE